MLEFGTTLGDDRNFNPEAEADGMQVAGIDVWGGLCGTKIEHAWCDEYDFFAGPSVAV